MSEHSQEPWRYEKKGHFITNYEGVIVDGTTFCIVRGERRTDMALPSDLRRIVACVNACKGIPTEALEKIGLSTPNWELSRVSFKILWRLQHLAPHDVPNEGEQPAAQDAS